MQRTLSDVIDALAQGKRQQRKGVLLLGAGVSHKAGVPLADEFVAIIHATYKSAYKRAAEKTYAHCMAALNDQERRELIARHSAMTPVNWAHLAVAELIRHGHVGWVLTTNFDPLVRKACAGVGEFPPVYDFAAVQALGPAPWPEKALFHLHGQGEAIVHLDEIEHYERLAALLPPLLEKAVQRGPLIAVGYGGRHDPVFDRLAAVPHFDHGLYWVGYRNEAPAPHVLEKVLAASKKAFHIGGFDADDFLVGLAQRLGCFPPELIKDPLSALERQLDQLMPFAIPGQAHALDLAPARRAQIRLLRDKAAPEAENSLIEAENLFLQGAYQTLIQRFAEQKTLSIPLRELIAWANIMLGNEAFELAAHAPGRETERLYRSAAAHYQAALRIKPEHPVALKNWGNVLLYQARGRKDEEAANLYQQACEKYAAYLAIQPGDPEALINWGCALCEQIYGRSSEAADSVYRAAEEKFAAALAVEPGHFKALAAWGDALVGQAGAKRGQEALNLYRAAAEKYQAALASEPDDHEVLNNLGLALLALARSGAPAEGQKLYEQAEQTLLAAEQRVPGFASYNLACLYSLRGEPEKCRQRLELSRNRGFLPSAAYVKGDPDLDSVRNLGWFKALVAKIG